MTVGLGLRHALQKTAPLLASGSLDSVPSALQRVGIGHKASEFIVVTHACDLLPMCGPLEKGAM